MRRLPLRRSESQEYSNTEVVCAVHGPAALKSGQEFVDACKRTVLVTAIWGTMYYNYVGASVLPVFCRAAYEMYTEKDITDRFGAIAGRWSGRLCCAITPFPASTGGAGAGAGAGGGAPL